MQFRARGGDVIRTDGVNHYRLARCPNSETAELLATILDTALRDIRVRLRVNHGDGAVLKLAGLAPADVQEAK